MNEIDLTRECRLCETAVGKTLVRVHWLPNQHWYDIAASEGSRGTDVWYLCTDCINSIKRLPS